MEIELDMWQQVHWLPRAHPKLAEIVLPIVRDSLHKKKSCRRYSFHTAKCLAQPLNITQLSILRYIIVHVVKYKKKYFALPSTGWRRRGASTGRQFTVRPRSHDQQTALIAEINASPPLLSDSKTCTFSK